MFNFNTNRRSAEPSINSALPKEAGAGNAMLNNRAAAQPQQGTEEAENQAYINARVQEIEAQREEFMKKRPDFDMKAEMQNPDFTKYVWKMGLTVEEAYYLVHREDLIREGVYEAMNRLAARRERIPENGAGKNSPAVVKKNPKDLTDSEIDSIIERVRNGEKVSF